MRCASRSAPSIVHPSTGRSVRGRVVRANPSTLSGWDRDAVIGCARDAPGVQDRPGDVMSAMHGFPSLSISEVKGLRVARRAYGALPRRRGDESTCGPEGQDLSALVADRDVQTIVDTILKHARTGAVGGRQGVPCCSVRWRTTGSVTGEAGEEGPCIGAPGTRPRSRSRRWRRRGRNARTGPCRSRPRSFERSSGPCTCR